MPIWANRRLAAISGFLDDPLYLATGTYYIRSYAPVFYITDCLSAVGYQTFDGVA